MRLNFFIGIRSTHHMMRKVLTGDSRISTPVLSLHKIGKGLFGNAILRVGFDDCVNSLLFDNPQAQECNIGIQHFNENNKNNVILKYFKPHSPVGTRFWFFKHKDINVTINEHYEFLKPYVRDKYLMKTYNFNKRSLNLAELPNLFDEEYANLDNMADILGADEWRDFDLSEYFGDGVSIPTPMQVRLYTL